MKRESMKRIVAMVLTMVVLSNRASALFGKKERVEAGEGSPVVQDLEIHTYRGIPYEGQFLGSDGEGEDITFSVVKEPRKGKVTIDGATFVYTPKEGVSGADSFTYTATDTAGNISLPATVVVSIEKTKSGVTYADTGDCAAASAAQYLAETGIFTGAKIGGSYYFEPDRSVTRSEFLAMVLEMTEREVTDVTMTGFCDDEVIPTWAKSYAAAGVADGIVQGKMTADGVAFMGDEPISFNEAATVLNRVMNVGDVDLDEWFAGRETVPSWAAQAVGNMEAISVLEAGSFGAAAMEQQVTRMDAAQMLEAASVLLKGEQTDSFLAWNR